MTHPSSPADYRGFQFGPFVVDAGRRLLWRDERLVPLTPRALDILLLLIEHRGEVVDKDTLLAAIWGNTVVEEATVVRHVSTLRKALHLRPDQHDVLVTLSGRGYRFVAPVTELEHLPVGLPTGPAADVVTDGAPQVLHVEADLPPAAPPAPAQAERRARRGAWVGGLAAAAVAAGAILLGPAAGTRFSAAPPALHWSEPPDLRQVTFESGVPRHPTWSPDGRAMAFTSDRAGNPDIWIQSVGDPNPVRLTTAPEADWQPDWSPGGESLVFRSERDGGGLYLVAPQGGKERRISSFGHHPRWSSDGQRILFVDTSREPSGAPALYVITRDQPAPRAVLADLTAEFSGFSVAWHGDGQHVSLWGRRNGNWAFVTAPLSGGAPRSSDIPANVRRWLDAERVTLRQCLWSRSGRYIYFEGTSGAVGNLWRVPVDRQSLAWTGMPERLTTTAARESDMALSRDGHLAFRSRVEQTRLWSFPLEQQGLVAAERGEPLTSGDSRELQPSASVASGRLVYQAVRGGYRELRALSLIDRREQLIASGTDRIGKAVLSSDGTRLAYVRRASAVTASAGPGRGSAAFVMVRWNGTTDGEYAVSADMPSALTPFDWSPDGRTVIGTCRTGQAVLAVCSMDVSAGAREPVIVTSDPLLRLFQAHFAPEAQWVVFMAESARAAGRSRLYVVPSSGGAWTPVTDGTAFDDKPRWSRDGRILYYLSDRDGFFNVWGRRFDAAIGQPSGEPFRVTSFRSSQRMISPENISDAEIAVDANRLVLPMTEVSSQIWMLEHVDR